MPLKPASPDDFASHLSVRDAKLRVRGLCVQHRLPSESVAVELALNRVLAEDVIVPHNLPPFVNSAMDGFALRGAEISTVRDRRFRVVGRMLAGSSSAPSCASGECIRIMTGAPLPSETDTVVVKENVRDDGDWVVVANEPSVGANVRPAGEDYRAGETALRRGHTLTAARLGVLASCGRARVQVSRLPRVALFVTGDELVPPDQALGFGQIHDSNRYSLEGLLRGIGVEPNPVTHLRDDADTLRAAFGAAAERCDLVVSSGGVSAGDADFLPAIVSELGRIDFWKVRMKPGMPLLCGEIGQALIFALPGNPVATIATFMTFVEPALQWLQGSIAGPRSWKARLASPCVKKHDRTEFLRATIESRDDGALWATPLSQQGSGMLRGVADAHALIIMDGETHALAAGSVVEIVPLHGLC